MRLLEHAKREFEIAGFNKNQEEGPDKWMQENVLELIEVFAKQGHSGGSAPLCVELFRALASYEPLSPLLGTEDEWQDVSAISGPGVEPKFQNIRCSHIFKNSDGSCFDVNGIIFRDTDGDCYTNADSRTAVTFPYTPKKTYMDVGIDYGTADKIVTSLGDIKIKTDPQMPKNEMRLETETDSVTIKNIGVDGAK